MIASPKSGKGNLIMNLLLNSNMFRDAFQDVYVFSSTSKADQTCKRLHEAFPGTVFDHFDERKLQSILDHQDNTPEEERGPIAIIVDDMVNLKAQSMFFQLATNYRHHHVALLVYSCQRLRMIPPVVRSNLTHFWIGTNSPAEMKRVSDEWSDEFGGEENFMRAYRQAVPERFNFLYGRLDQFPSELYRNFDQPALYAGE